MPAVSVKFVEFPTTFGSIRSKHFKGAYVISVGLQFSVHTMYMHVVIIVLEA